MTKRTRHLLNQAPRLAQFLLSGCFFFCCVQQSIGQSYLDPMGAPPATAGWPGNSGVTMQGIQPFDPYAAAPALPPPMNSSAYPAPPGGYLGNPGQPPLGTAPGAGPFQPSFNFLGGGLYGGFQATILEPRFGNFAIASNRFDRPITFESASDFGFSFAPRIILGYEGPEGLGVRGRWWRFSDRQAGRGSIFFSNPGEVVDGVATTTELKAETIELELTQDGRFHNWEFLVSGGVRYATLDSITRADWVNPVTNQDTFFTTDTDFNGVGPVLGLSTRRAMQQWEGLTFVLNSRFSFLFGDVDIQQAGNVDGPDEGPFTRLNVDDVMPIWELQIGAQYARRLNSGATLYLGGFFETQLWDFVGPSGINSDLGFWGPTFAVGISR